MILEADAFIRNHELLFAAHGKTPAPGQPACRCILCDIFRKHLKEDQDHENQLHLPFD